jgi:hypothetical protein
MECDRSLGEDEADIVVEAVVELAQPPRPPIHVWRPGIQPDLALANLDRVGSGVVGEEVERATAGEIELGMVPVAGEDAVSNGASVQGKAHVGAGLSRAKTFPPSRKTAMARPPPETMRTPSRLSSSSEHTL